MKIRNIFLITTILLPICLACDNQIIFDDNNNENKIIGSGDVITLKKNFTNFNKIHFSHALEAEINFGSTYEVSIKIDDNFVDYLIAEEDQENLTIGLINKHNYSNYTLKVTISMPDILSLDMIGASSSTITGFNFEHYFEADMSGASWLGGELNTGDIKLVLLGASKVEFKGQGKNLDVLASGASYLYLGSFKVINADLNLSGASLAYINADRYIDADLTGASYLNYCGNCSLRNVSTSGASLIQRYNP